MTLIENVKYKNAHNYGWYVTFDLCVCAKLKEEVKSVCVCVASS